MSRRLLGLYATFVLVISLLVMTLTASVAPAPPEARSVESLTMFKAAKFDGHYRVPHTAEIEQILREEKILLPGDDAAEVETAVQTFTQEWNKRNPVTPNPGKLRDLLKKEHSLEQLSDLLEMATASTEDEDPEESQIQSLAVPVEFPNEDTFEHCGETVTTVGPLHNEIAPPGPRDNNTIWYEDTSPELYEELYFGTGPDAGVIVEHPNLGSVDLRGNTMANYYMEQSEGAFVPTGMIYPKWLQAAHSEGWYGADGCTGGSHNIRAHNLVAEVVDLINADDPDFPWQDFDGDENGIVDNFTVIHAGMGQEAGGGAQGDFAIWSHASVLDWPTGYLACTAGSMGCPDRNIVVREYSMDPENIDIGVIAEEFGHAAFGLPDIYTTDYQNSVANWAIMSAGSWNGPLGGMQPAPFPLWFRYIIGWSDPVELDYTTDPTTVMVGQHSLRPHWAEQGLKINLPDKEVHISNPLETGDAWWSDVGDLMQNTLTHEFDLAGTTAPILSFNSYWSIEIDWDYGYVEVSNDGGDTWTLLQDMDGIFTDTDPNGNNEGWGLTGEGSGTLRFDLSDYVGQTVLVRLRYSTDMAVQWEGWWADDVSLDDGATNLFFDDVEGETGAWAADGWRIVPITEIYSRYYLVEWRNLSGFDKGLQYPYQTVYYDDDEWEVDRAPYSVPGMLVWLRDASHGFDYTLSDSLYDSPSWGPKHALLVVDSHFFPYTWDEYTYSTGAGVRVSGRVQPADATFTKQDTTPFTLRLGYDPATGEYVDEPLETKTFGPRPGVRQFHDSMSYYPGLYFTDDGYLYWRQLDASVVVPAQEDYTTKITDLDGNPLYSLYGIDIGGTILGSGNPGDDSVQYGLHLAVQAQAHDGSWGAITVWNSPLLVDLEKDVNRAKARPGQILRYTIQMRNTTPTPQAFVLDDPIPEHTTLVWGKHYDPDTNSIHLEGVLPPGVTIPYVFMVRIDKDTPAGTIITNEAYLADDATGDSASATTEVK